MQKRIQIAFVAGFFALISLQFAVFYLCKNYIDTQNYENRKLLTMQDVLAAPPQNMASQFEKMLNDNAPFKNQYLKLNAALNYKLFGTVQSSEVLLGKNDWLFYKNVSDSKSLDDYQGLNVYNAEQNEEFAQALTRLNELLKAKNTQLQILIAPNKEGIYSGFMPDYIPVIGATKAEVLYDYLKKNTQVAVFYPKEQLKKQSATQQVYYKYDTHWNSAGALLALQQMSPAFDACTAFIAQGEPMQDLANLSAMQSLLPPDDFFDVNSQPLQTNQTLVMLHDSFGYALLPYLEKAYNATFFNASQFDAQLINSKADIVIIEAAERYIDLMLPRIKAMITVLEQN